MRKKTKETNKVARLRASAARKLRREARKSEAAKATAAESAIKLKSMAHPRALAPLRAKRKAILETMRKYTASGFVYAAGSRAAAQKAVIQSVG